MKWPQLQIEIGRHTRRLARARRRYNQRLIEARVKTVLAYLSPEVPDAHSPDSSRSRATGRQNVPMVPNTSELSLAKNRRVEFVVQNKDVLKKERTRRHLLEKGGRAEPGAESDPAPADTTQH